MQVKNGITTFGNCLIKLHKDREFIEKAMNWLKYKINHGRKYKCYQYPVKYKIGYWIQVRHPIFIGLTYNI